MSNNLRTYLNDHLAGARFAVDLLHHLCNTLSDQELKKLAQDLVHVIEEDRAVLKQIVDAVSEDRGVIKEAAAWLSEKASRLKLRLSDDDDLALFEAFEVLSLGVLGKIKLWQALREVADRDAQLGRLDLQQLIERALGQHDAIEIHRRKLAKRAFAPN
jgi:hypothetical protein